MPFDFLAGSIRRTVHAGDDDLLSAGLGLAGLAGEPVAFVDPQAPTPAELRRRAIQSAWKGLTDFSTQGGYGKLYGAVPAVAGREYGAFARLPNARHTHRVLCQVPDGFDRKARCLLLAPASGSRGIYGAISLAGAWGLPRGCAVVYTDKGAGSGYFDAADGTGVALDGTRAVAGETALEFEPEAHRAHAGIATKHAHSGDHPEADWGAHVMQAARFGLAMLDEALPSQAPFTPENTRIIAVGVSNGGGAVLQAAGIDRDGWLDGVVALEPNVHVRESGRALYDYAAEAALLMPAALCAPRFSAAPFARVDEAVPPGWAARGENLHAHGFLQADEPAARADEAIERLKSAGWDEDVIEAAASSTLFDMWRMVLVTYASAYLRRRFGDMPCGFSFMTVDDKGLPAPASPAVQALWWPDGSGLAPDIGVGLSGPDGVGADACFQGTLALRELWTGEGALAESLHESVDQLGVALPRKALPIWVVHGADDGLVPAAFSSAPYIDWLRSRGRTPRYWRVPHAQHFDAFLLFPQFGERYVPLLPYGYEALDRVFDHVVNGALLPDRATPGARPRGSQPLDKAHLDL